MHDPHCLYVVMHAPPERMDDLLLVHLAPVVDVLRVAPELDSLFFVRYSEPRWQLRFRVLGRPEWVEGPVRGALESLTGRLEREGRVEDVRFTRYDRELERYGGPEGMALAERLFLHDSLLALDLLGLERAGRLGRSRREVALLVAQRLSVLAGLTEDEQIAYYARGHAWAHGAEGWGPAERAALEQRFARLRPGLEALLLGPAEGVARWAGEECAARVEAFERAAAPILAEIAAGARAGRIAQDLPYLLWSYAHMFTNRLGIESSGEAVLRYFAHRVLEERRREAREPGP